MSDEKTPEHNLKCPHCEKELPAHICLQGALIIRLGSRLDLLEQHAKDGKGWRNTIIIACIGIVGQILLLASMWGSLNTRVQYHENMLAELKQGHERLTIIASQIPVNTDRLNKVESYIKYQLEKR